MPKLRLFFWHHGDSGLRVRGSNGAAAKRERQPLGDHSGPYLEVPAANAGTVISFYCPVRPRLGRPATQCSNKNPGSVPRRTWIQMLCDLGRVTQSL